MKKIIITLIMTVLILCVPNASKGENNSVPFITDSDGNNGLSIVDLYLSMKNGKEAWMNAPIPEDLSKIKFTSNKSHIGVGAR